MLGWKDQNKITDKSDDATRRDKLKDIRKRRKTLKNTETESSNINKIGLS